MGFEENIYRYLGLGVVILVALYILIKTLTFQGKIIEGLTNSTTETTSDPTTSAEISLLNTVASKSTEGITAQNNKLQDVLALDKYRTDYENLIIALDDYANVMMFAKVLGVGAKVSKLSNGEPVTNGIIEDMENANKLKATVYLCIAQIACLHIVSNGATASFIDAMVEDVKKSILELKMKVKDLIIEVINEEFTSTYITPPRC